MESFFLMLLQATLRVAGRILEGHDESQLPHSVFDEKEAYLLVVDQVLPEARLVL